MNQTEQKLSQKVETLYWKRERCEIGTDDYNDINTELTVANDDLDKLRQENCIEHRKRIYPEGGYDRCAECGSRF